MKITNYIFRILCLSLFLIYLGELNAQNQMMFGDTTRLGRPYSKDPHVVKFNGAYIMYYSVPPFPNQEGNPKGWNIGIAKSNNLTKWEKIGEIVPEGDYEAKGLCAPGALVRNGTIHLFYQTYGNEASDAICHAYSTDGVNFIRNTSNPIFAPTGDWNCGRQSDRCRSDFS